jgi:hypothetical protein
MRPCIRDGNVREPRRVPGGFGCSFTCIGPDSPAFHGVEFLDAERFQRFNSLRCLDIFSKRLEQCAGVEPAGGGVGV